MVARAAFLTSALVSQIASAMTGMMAGICLAIWAAAWVMRMSMISRDPVLTCHLPAVLICWRRISSMIGEAHGDMTLAKVLTASTAAARTCFSLSAKVSEMIWGRTFSNMK